MKKTALLLLFLLLFVGVGMAQAERRVALVIGNGAYKSAPLKNPVNDARDMAASLRPLGFEVLLLEDATLRDMEGAVDEFWKLLKLGGVGLFYYAGHGLQVQGNNYLVPVDALLSVEQDVKFRCMDAGLVLGRMEDAGNGLNLVILDACRNNPLARNFRSAAQGLARMDAPAGSLVAFATAPNSVASDGGGRNGTYTSFLLKHMTTPGIKVEDLLKTVRRDVSTSTEKKQIPWDLSSLVGDFYFIPPATTEPAKPTELAKPVEPVKPVEPANPAKPSFFSWLFSPSPSTPAVKQATAAQDQLDKSAVSVQTQESAKEKPPLEAKGRSQKAVPATPRPARPRAGEVWTEPVLGMEFVWVPGGCYKMGSPGNESGRALGEGPEHQVCVDGLWVGRREVTNAQYRLYRPNHDSGKSPDGSSLAEDQQPVVQVSWSAAKEFAGWLGKKNGGSVRLPTEAEWEYAARAGASTARPWGNSAEEACASANVRDKSWRDRQSDAKAEGFHNCDDGHAVAARVGSFPPNAFGLYDMIGNAGEWCEDEFFPLAYSLHDKQNPVHRGTGFLAHTVRGGNWASGPETARSAARAVFVLPQNETTGFRLVMER